MQVVAAVYRITSGHDFPRLSPCRGRTAIALNLCQMSICIEGIDQVVSDLDRSVEVGRFEGLVEYQVRRLGIINRCVDHSAELSWSTYFSDRDKMMNDPRT